MFLLLMENAQNVSIVNGECTECLEPISRC